MDQLRRLGNVISIQIPADENGFTGREYPQPECEGYFKIGLGTGLKGTGLPCHCPYCGYTASHDHFWTQEQLEYAKSVAMKKITDAIHKDLKKLEFDHKAKGAFGIGISMKVTPGRPAPIHYYGEKQLETEVVCVNCTLRYSVYGVFAFCPDCGQHNSLQILDKNLEVVGKMLDLALGTESELADKLVENALEDCVSAFDGFGRELCGIHSNWARDPAKIKKISFQNLERAQSIVLDTLGIDLSAAVAASEWRSACIGFQKRHLVAHKAGVVDLDYIVKTGTPRGLIGRKIAIKSDDVRALALTVREIALHLSNGLQEAQARQ